VLVVSCPCALSLATPTALAAATDHLLRQGVLVTGPQTLETLHRATHIVLDKTGTLTWGRPVLQQIQALGAMRAEFCLQVAAALEAGSAHPLARAIIAAADEAGRWRAVALQETPGRAWKACAQPPLPPGQRAVCRRHQRPAAARVVTASRRSTSA
jgi:Cu2+-exporting ATPase